jgi:hypothetical protein
MSALARFWYVPVSEVAHDDHEAALLDSYVDEHVLQPYAPQRLRQEGVQNGDILALIAGTTVLGLARVIQCDGSALRWWRLDTEKQSDLPSQPALGEVPESEAKQFSFGVRTLLQDVNRPMPAPHGTGSKPRNIILYGAPGTGKTFSTKKLGIRLALGDPGWEGSKEDTEERWDDLLRQHRVVFLTFHQAFAYEDFIEGLRPRLGEAGNEVSYEIADGVFKRLALLAAAAGLHGSPSEPEARIAAARKALQDGTTFSFPADAPQYVLVIDEINRANVARVFGELITLLEPDKRLGQEDSTRLRLPASGEWFAVPPNLHVIGTLNTADRSIALMDVALRRRFEFEEMAPDAALLEKILTAKAVDPAVRALTLDLFRVLNLRLRFLYDREHQVGHCWFLGVRSVNDLRRVFAGRVLPLLQEYFYGQWDKVGLVLGHPRSAPGAQDPKLVTVDGPASVLVVEKLSETSVLGFNHDDHDDQFAYEFHPHFRGAGVGKDEEWTRKAMETILKRASGGTPSPAPSAPATGTAG